ncbi:hypothetical protein [Streptomyces roseicoloratus]|uniref:Uncharacterized protein n=1 Tax=Streptomyces roseicoloratus TaxID=2508722 RepID=A0ABY9S2J4_9ACTN|nr:hypothetical protein [Streptomyces roseicoloratus]WMX48648.1 hypothetical protein RGF97_32965 [Streptomyces roseicoloratus]
MAMVGLFWIAEGDVYVGAKPTGTAPGVRLTADGVVALGDGQDALYPWEDVNALAVSDAPVKTLRRQVGVFTEVALDTVMNLAVPVGPVGSVEAPPLMTLSVGTASGERAVKAYVAAAVGYSSTEVELSRALLSRLTEGAATMATTLAAMAEWGRAWEGGSPRVPQREALLREWLG